MLIYCSLYKFSFYIIWTPSTLCQSHYLCLLNSFACIYFRSTFYSNPLRWMPSYSGNDLTANITEKLILSNQWPLLVNMATYIESCPSFSDPQGNTCLSFCSQHFLPCTFDAVFWYVFFQVLALSVSFSVSSLCVSLCFAVALCLFLSNVLRSEHLYISSNLQLSPYVLLSDFFCSHVYGLHFFLSDSSALFYSSTYLPIDVTLLPLMLLLFLIIS